MGSIEIDSILSNGMRLAPLTIVTDDSRTTLRDEPRTKASANAAGSHP